MNLTCRLGLHRWEGCSCRRCSETRHDWNGCSCRKCSETRHHWNGSKCTACSTIRPFRPARSDPKCYPFTLEPGAEKEAEEIAQLCGYAIWFTGEESILGFGETIAWQTADVTDDEFIQKCRLYCAQAQRMSRPMLASHCLGSMPLISKYVDWFKEYGRDAWIGQLTLAFKKEVPETAVTQSERGAPMARPLDDLVKRAGANRRIVCGSMVEYFQEVVKKMYEAGVDRRGSGRKEQIGGKSYIIDVWVLPDGTTVECGYPE